MLGHTSEPPVLAAPATMRPAGISVALRAIAREAFRRKSGARGLRAIMEEIMLDVMYDIPSQAEIEEVVISEEVVERKESPIVVYASATRAS